MLFSVLHAGTTILLCMGIIAGIADRRKKGILNITAILVVYLVTEITVEYLLPKGVYNHYVYAISHLISALLTANYFRICTSKGYFHLICLSLALVFTYIYVTYEMWDREFVLPVNMMAFYYFSLTILSLNFIWIQLVDNKLKKQFMSTQFGWCFLLYYLLALLNNSPEFAVALERADKLYFFWAFNGLNFTFYATLSLLLLKLRFSKIQHDN